MYKLILVEDEEDVREGMLSEIDWLGFGFEVADTAENGREAIELIEKWSPDVVITDIKMPFMDGLQLTEWLVKHDPTIRVIILTGFDEFEYAQKAIKLHIDEYVLKPFSANELIDALLKVKHRMDEESARKKDLLLLRDHYRKSLPVLREVFLASLVTRKLPRMQIEEQSLHYQIDILANAYSVAAISIDASGNGMRAGDTLAESLRYSMDMELKIFAALNVAEEIVAKNELGLVFLHNGVLVVIARHQQYDVEQTLKRMLATMEEIRQCVEKYLKFTVTIGISTLCSDIADLSHGFKDAMLAIDYRIILGGNRLIYIGDVETRFAEKLHFDELKEQALIRCLKVGTTQEIEETVDELFEGITEARVSIHDYQVYLMEILTAVLKTAKDAQADIDAIFGTDFAPLAELQRITQLQEARSWLLKLCMNLAQGIATERQYTYKSLVHQAKEYTLAHYHESDISIHKVCSYLHISAGYFSSIFKKEAKMTFGAYLMNIRMEAAKELLRTTDLKSFEISERVGYTEPNYFSFSFRKAVGISPKEYRNTASGASS